MRCLITGCALVSVQEGWATWGDLFEVGDTYVFNAMLHKGEALRSYQRPVPYELKQLLIHESFAPTYFERRGVIVISKADASLNATAKEYLK